MRLVGPHGRCTERAFLEFHHRQPYAAGGKATVDNIELRCRAHNAYEAQLFFTWDAVRERRPTWPEPTAFRSEEDLNGRAPTLGTLDDLMAQAVR